MTVNSRNTSKDSDRHQQPPEYCGCNGTTTITETTLQINTESSDAILDETKMASLSRPVLPQKSFDQMYKLSRPEKKSFKSKLLNGSSWKCLCSYKFFSNMLIKRIPLLYWLPKYDARNFLLNDMIGGVTVGIMHIPQGMAYALLANLPPVVGLYVSFFSVLVYFILGTSRHLSMGTFAVISLMTGNIINSYLSGHPLDSSSVTLPANESFRSNIFVYSVADNDNGNSSLPQTGTSMSPSTTTDDLQAYKIQLAAAIAFIVGIMQLGMAVFQMGALSVYLSDTLVSGFTTGAALHVFNSQIKYLFGIHVPNFSGMFGVFYTYAAIITTINQTNIYTFILSLIVTVSLVLVNDCINARYREKMIMPVPMELLVIICTTLLSYYMELNKKYGVNIVNNIPTGLPLPKVPRYDIVTDIATQCVALAVVSYCIPISLAKIFAKKHKYDIDANQELIAYGAGNVVGSFFSCFPGCASLSRSTVQELSGAKTQVASVMSCTLVLIVLLFIAPLFEPVPNCVLASIIVVALRGMFRQVSDLLKAWKESKKEAAIWLVAFLGVVILDVDIGLLVSVLFLLITVLYKIQRPYTTVLGNVPSTDVYLDLVKYKVSKEVFGIKIIHFGGALYFANRDYFRRQMYELVFDPQKELERRIKIEKKKHNLKKVDDQNTISCENLVDASKQENPDLLFQENVIYNTMDEKIHDLYLSEEICKSPQVILPQAIIIDCCVMGFIDTAAISMFLQLSDEYNEVGVHIYLAGLKDQILLKLERCDCYDKLEPFIFPTIHDAVLHVTSQTSKLFSPSDRTEKTHL